MFNKLDDIIYEFDGKKYQWDWVRWTDSKNMTLLPVVIKELNLKLKESIANKEIDLSNLENKELTTLASNFKDADAPGISLYIIENLILTKDPKDSFALSVLCSLLRKLGKPKEALEKTKNNSGQSTALFTSRAAAMCDLGLWKEAHDEVGRALGKEKDPQKKIEAFNVVKRIKEAAPYLYKNN